MAFCPLAMPATAAGAASNHCLTLSNKVNITMRFKPTQLDQRSKYARRLTLKEEKDQLKVKVVGKVHIFDIFLSHEVYKSLDWL